MKLTRHLILIAGSFFFLSCSHCGDKEENYRAANLMFNSADSLLSNIENGSINVDSSLISSYYKYPGILKSDIELNKKYFAGGYIILSESCDELPESKTVLHTLLIQSSKDSSVVVRLIFEKDMDKNGEWKYLGARKP